MSTIPTTTFIDLPAAPGKWAPAAFILLLACAHAQATTPDAARQAELLHLLKHDCGSCHGMTRRGGLGPPLLPPEMQEQSRLLLRNTVLDGRPGTAMPPWRGLLSEQDVHWLVEALVRGEGL